MISQIRTATAAVAVSLMLAPASWAGSTTTVTIDPSTLNLGFMNVFNINPDGTAGDFQFGSGWGFADLTASFAGDVLTVGPNTVGDPDPYWYVGGGGPGAPGNKYMEANAYAEVADGSLAGVTLTFEGTVLSNSFTDAHSASLFIRDFASDFSSSVDTIIPLPLVGDFSFSQTLINDPTRVVQYGVRVEGVNVWVTDVDPFGFAEIAPRVIPVPAAVWLFASGLLGLMGLRRRG